MFLEHGTDIPSCDGKGQKPLHLAARRGRLILEVGAGIGSRDGDGLYPDFSV